MRYLAYSVLIVFLCACSASSPLQIDRSDRYIESLEMKIMPDGSKVFHYLVAYQQGSRNKSADDATVKELPAVDDEQRQRKKAKGSNDRTRSSRQRTEAGSNDNSKTINSQKLAAAKDLKNYFENRLANLNILKVFCQKDYFVLAELIEPKEISIQAECRDSASAEDYNKFTKAE